MPVDAPDAALPGLWIGTWSMGGEGFGPHDLSLSARTLETAFDIGIRHFDTAGFYAQGRSEELLSKVFRKKRTRIFISTKGGLCRQGRVVWHDGTPDGLRKALTESLKRLGTDYVDLFQLHWPDPAVPLDESLDALRHMRSQGLIRFYGAGNLSPAQIERHIRPGQQLPLQTHFNPLRMEARQVLEAGSKEKRCINCVVSPFEQGLLASSQLLSRRLGRKDLRNRNPLFSDPEARERVRSFFSGCTASGVSPVKAVLHWLKKQEYVDVLIPGPRRPEQLMETVEAFCDRHDCSWIVEYHLLRDRSVP